MITLKTIDAHVAGAPLRLVVDGFPSPRGRTMIEKRDWVEGQADSLRRLLMLEPRGHRDMCGAILTEPVSPGSHAGLVFMQSDSYPVLSLHAVMAATAIAVARQLIVPGGDGRTIVFDTPSGTIRARAAEPVDGGCTVIVQNVPAFVLAGGLPVVVPGAGHRTILADVAYGGAFCAIVDSEAAGLGVDTAHLPELRRMGEHIARVVETARTIEHPLDDRLGGISATVFTGPAADGGADLRCVTVSASGQVDRSPSGTAISAVMAVLSAMGLLADEQTFVAEGIIGTSLIGRLLRRTAVGEAEAIVPEIEGRVWLTGEHTFMAEEADTIGQGFLV